RACHVTGVQTCALPIWSSARWNLAFTSADVKGRPSWNKTPRRRRKTYSVASGDTVHDSAKAGTISPSGVILTKPSNTLWWTMAVAAVAVVADGSSPGGSADWTTTRCPPRTGAAAAWAKEARPSNISNAMTVGGDQRTAAALNGHSS